MSEPARALYALVSEYIDHLCQIQFYRQKIQFRYRDDTMSTLLPIVIKESTDLSSLVSERIETQKRIKLYEKDLRLARIMITSLERGENILFYNFDDSGEHTIHLIHPIEIPNLEE